MPTSEEVVTTTRLVDMNGSVDDDNDVVEVEKLKSPIHGATLEDIIKTIDYINLMIKPKNGESTSSVSSTQLQSIKVISIQDISLPSH